MVALEQLPYLAETSPSQPDFMAGSLSAEVSFRAAGAEVPGRQ